MATLQATFNHGMGASLDFSKSQDPARYKNNPVFPQKTLQTLIDFTPLFPLANPRKTQSISQPQTFCGSTPKV
jgi:hypothetical protein